jgi:hypothetical protein
MIGRREVLGTLTGSLLTPPLAAGAQQARSAHQIGAFFNAFSSKELAPQAF